jgi:hypothetical protein
MMDKRLFVIPLILILFVSSACGFSVNLNVEQGSGVIVKETRDVNGFDRVSLSGIGDVTLVQADNEALEIEAEDNVISNITTEVRDGTLYIGFGQKSVIPTKPIRFYLTMRDIHGLETKGISNIKSDEVQTDKLEIGISGTGNIDIERLVAESLTVNVSGAGNFTCGGQVDQQEINLSGAGNYNGEDLQSKETKVTITGLGKVTVWTTENLDVTISGGGEVDYYGSPQISQQISGLGELTHLGDK